MSGVDYLSNINNNNSEQRYCICQKREDELGDQDDNDFMIECDGCNQWFHGRCISLPNRVADDIEKYFCNECSKQYGPSIFKQRKNLHRRDYSDANAENKPIESGTKDFINQLKRKIFLNCESVITRMKGHELTSEYLYKTGFTKPIFIAKRDGLDLTLPNRMIKLEEINELVGHDQYVDVIDCEKQVTYQMKLDDYIKYFQNYDRNKIYNVLSLEISNTKLGQSITIPKIVREISWSTNGIWPNQTKDEMENDVETNGINPLKRKVIWSSEPSSSNKKSRTLSSTTDTDQSDDDDEDLKANHFENFEHPQVSKYCLMSPQSSYTDFHIDFGGSSVWYSVVRGEKIFYLIEPTDENLQKYADWSKSSNASETFFGDCVSHCYTMHLREENTVFIPAGWIHAVYTITDSLVFGGNFLQSMGVDMQLRIYELECLANVPYKFKYPLFETFQWYAAKNFYDELREYNNSNSSIINPVIQQASEALIYHLNRWLTADKRYQTRNRYIIPKGLHCEKLLNGLARELDLAKTRCGFFNNSSQPSKTIITSPLKVQLSSDNKQEFVEMARNKLKVKCRRLSSDSETPKNTGHCVKLTIKPLINPDHKDSHSQNSSKKTSNRPKSEDSSKMTYTLDLEAKRQCFIQHSTVASLADIDNDQNDSAMSGQSPTDCIETREHQEILSNIDEDGLTSFIKRSVVDTPTDKKLTKKIKTASIKPLEGTNTSKTETTSTKKRLKSSSKKVHSNDRLGKVLKIASSMKSRTGIWT